MTFEILPTTPCDQCMNDPNCRAHGQDLALSAVYCQHRLAGGVLRHADRVWTVWSPITFEQYTDHLAKLSVLHLQLTAQQDGLAPPTATH